MRKALVVGVDYYRDIPPLTGCVNDAHSVTTVLERHGDGSINFDVKLVAAAGPADFIDRGSQRDSIEMLFSGDPEIALLYFAGHGFIDATGGYLCGSDVRRGDDGVALHDILTWANTSGARNKVIILDSCYSGIAGDHPVSRAVELTDGLTILTASTAEQYASEEDGGGVFTGLLVDAMMGAAGKLVGDVTPGSVYAHIDQSLGPWEQRPVFKTNVKSFVSLRKVVAPIDLAELRRITEFFPGAGYEFQLDPSYEPELQGRPEGAPPPDPENNAVFAILQRFNRVNLVVPVSAPQCGTPPWSPRRAS